MPDDQILAHQHLTLFSADKQGFLQFLALK